MKQLINRTNLIRTGGVLAIYLAVFLLMQVGIIDSYLFLNLVTIGINIILAVSLNLITGYTGQFSLGHASFMAIGAYTSGILTARLDLPFIVGVLGAAVMAALAGVLIGAPTLRLKGDYLAIATLGFGEIVRIIGLNWEYAGGAMGLNDIPRYTTWTWLFALTVLTVVVISNFIHSRHGRAVISIREDEIASSSMGVNTSFYKVLVFSLGALFAGVAGALYANYFYFIKPSSFGFMRSIDILVFVVMGGLGSIRGSIVSAIALTLISLSLQGIPELRMVLYAVILFIMMVYKPQRLLGRFRTLIKKEA
ncbi:branched-chain amino acid ABC transporter permease [Proteiniclasticum sp. QWL-01]|uniref:branched-chain amino acid ABC transporter permease n=1 Tax=Proteiniclasticum sp. QWL-01 TaxID=3036945 RepID=UPI0021FC4FCC|nr:branched-chain amino acid ABC transporter permease [Proteiniclasticum sp. QWL-01]UUM11218.1 branched-chain amino acid ABC transporter permease [Clostridiaceae bacterium HFYG-1003]WFF72558.1 branched-chain amino acid ABC transporter permease [Proteiniclasticum sp. QWL-01]